MDEDRNLVLVAAEIWLSNLYLDHRTSAAIHSALRLGFAIGSKESPADFVPAVALNAARDAKVQAEKYREQIAEDARGMNLTQAIGGAVQRGPGGLW